MYKIHQIEGYIQTIYLIEDNNKLLLLDGCTRADVQNVINYIQDILNRPLSDLKLVIATHSHPDHLGGIELFQKRGIQVAGPSGLGKEYFGLIGVINYLIDIALSHLVAINKKKKIQNIFYKRKVKVDYILEDNSPLPGFPHWMAIKTPGHTNIDISIIHQESKTAYVADNIVGSDKRIFSPYPITSIQKYKESLKLYIDREIETFLLAHYGVVSLKRDQILKLIETTPDKNRVHRNTIHQIFLKLIKSIFQ